MLNLALRRAAFAAVLCLSVNAQAATVEVKIFASAQADGGSSVLDNDITLAFELGDPTPSVFNLTHSQEYLQSFTADPDSGKVVAHSGSVEYGTSAVVVQDAERPGFFQIKVSRSDLVAMQKFDAANPLGADKDPLKAEAPIVVDRSLAQSVALPEGRESEIGGFDIEGPSQDGKPGSHRYYRVTATFKR